MVGLYVCLLYNAVVMDNIFMDKCQPELPDQQLDAQPFHGYFSTDIHRVLNSNVMLSCFTKLQTY